MDKRVEDVPSTSYIKVESPIERRLYTALVLHGYPVLSQVKGGPYRIDLVLGRLSIHLLPKQLLYFHTPASLKEIFMLIRNSKNIKVFSTINHNCVFWISYHHNCKSILLTKYPLYFTHKNKQCLKDTAYFYDLIY